MCCGASMLALLLESLPLGLLAVSLGAAVCAHIDNLQLGDISQLSVSIDFDHNEAGIRSTILCSCLLCCGWYLARAWGARRAGWMASLLFNMVLYSGLMAYRGMAFPGMVNAEPVNFVYAAGMLLLFLLVAARATAPRPSQQSGASSGSGAGKAVAGAQKPPDPSAALNVLDAVTAHALLGLFTTAYTVLSLQDLQAGSLPSWQRCAGVAACYATLAAWLLTQLARSTSQGGGSGSKGKKAKTA